MKATVICRLRLRAEPSTDAKIITILEPGETVTLKEQVGGVWWKCTYKRKNGYIMAAYIEREEVKDDGQTGATE